MPDAETGVEACARHGKLAGFHANGPAEAAHSAETIAEPSDSATANGAAGNPAATTATGPTEELPPTADVCAHATRLQPHIASPAVLQAEATARDPE